jgi:hypothetical protein
MNKRYILILVFLHVAIVLPVLAGENMLENPSFEFVDGDRLINWFASPAEPDAILQDNDEFVSGEHSVKIAHKKLDSYSWILQTVKVEPKSVYLLTGYIRTEDVAIDSTGLGPRIIIADGSGNAISQVISSSGTNNWQEVKVEFRTEEETTINIIPYLHKAKGTVWFDDLKFTFVGKMKNENIDGIPFKLSGSIYSNVFYNPETGLKTDNYLHMSSYLNKGGTNSIVFYIYTCYESSGKGFEQGAVRKFNPWFDRLIVTLNGPLHPSLKSISVTLGQGWLNYSPYIAKFNYDYSKSGQGIMASGLRFLDADWSGFLIWEGSKPYRNIGNGIRVRGGSKPWKYEVIAVRSLEGNPETDSNGKVISLGSYRLQEKDFSLQLEREFGDDIKLNLLHLEQQRYMGQKRVTKANKIELGLPIKNQQLLITYRNFEPGFAPRYRDSTPKYQGRTKLGWNPIDRYRSQRGIMIKSSGSIFGREVELELDRFVLQPEYTDKRINFSFQMEGKTYFKFLGTLDKGNYPYRYLEAGLAHELLKGKPFNIIGLVNILDDRTGNNNNLKAKGVVTDYGFQVNMRRNYLAGLRLTIGIQNFKKSYKYVRGQWQLFGNIKFDFAYRLPNESDLNEEYWFDEYERMHNGDNYIMFNSIVSF